MGLVLSTTRSGYASWTGELFIWSLADELPGFAIRWNNNRIAIRVSLLSGYRMFATHFAYP
jgi:hypothetical protein